MARLECYRTSPRSIEESPPADGADKRSPKKPANGRQLCIPARPRGRPCPVGTGDLCSLMLTSCRSRETSVAARGFPVEERGLPASGAARLNRGVRPTKPWRRARRRGGARPG